MREYISIYDKNLRRSTRIAGVVAGFVLIGLGIYISSIFSAVVGVVILLAILLQKTISVTEQGLLVTYNAIFYKYKELWEFSEITELHQEMAPDGTRCALHFTKGAISKRLVFSLEDTEKTIALALEKNPDIHFAHVD